MFGGFVFRILGRANIVGCYSSTGTNQQSLCPNGGTSHTQAADG
jgi:hypothetical protein